MPGGNKAGGGLKTKQSAFYLRSGNKPSPLEFFQGGVSRARMYNPDYKQEDVSELEQDASVDAGPDRVSDVSRERMFIEPSQITGRQNLSRNYMNVPPVEESTNVAQDMRNIQDIPAELTRGSRSADVVAAMQATNDGTGNVNNPFEIKRKRRNPGYLGSNV